MSVTYDQEISGEGIRCHTLINGRYKTNTIIIHLVTGLREDTAAQSAVIPYVLAGSSEEYPSLTALNKRLAELYGGVIRGTVSKLGDCQALSLMMSCLGDRYAFDGEAVTEEMTRILAGCLTRPHLEDGVFCRKDFLLKKQELMDSISAEINEKRSFAFKRAGRIIYEGEPAACALRGELSAAEELTAEGTYDRYRELLRTARMEIFFVGAADMPECRKILMDAVSAIDRAPGEYSSEPSPAKKEVRRVTERYDVTQSKLVMAFKTGTVPGLAEAKLMNAMLGGTPTSKLFLNVREKNSLCYYCSSGYNDRKGTLIIDSGVEKINIEKAEAEILRQLEAMKRGDFSDEETEDARRDLVNTLRGIGDNPRSAAEWYFSRCGDGISPEQLIRRLEKVTREDIVEISRSLKPDTVYVLTGKESE